MNLEKATEANLEYLINEIKAKLKLVNAALINPNDFNLGQYEEIREIYELIEKKQGKLTMMEIEGILEELRDLRQK
ncbi:MULTISPECIES: DUF1128 domain-containing protein [Thermoactinomyces]|uniref:DUF1128 family protein n=1 Tax=Thermoactinomyces daqus TaxID=1329516 RepID=A0A7W1XA28_9BACL|nr:DUF1128 family protein [Thermoactinomyces daqus]MBA4542769.1 DUF1128 family protein [Thermoactinomyces daqus]MBH8598558.1 DUF1128 family protein [Thermoactinomyces sp. CICC 10523]MBH8604598.1 DUF1128 family protein [Thermoactinomyces sp. CICC 10522]MBH8606943.1 DUF1128 family protein [Thermoactinomyces sp. CICC 10521]